MTHPAESSPESVTAAHAKTKAEEEAKAKRLEAAKRHLALLKVQEFSPEARALLSQLRDDDVADAGGMTAYLSSQLSPLEESSRLVMPELNKKTGVADMLKKRNAAFQELLDAWELAGTKFKNLL